MASHKRVGSWSGFWGLITKLHRSSWMSDVLPSAARLFFEMLLASEAGPGPKNPKVNPLCGKSSRAVVWLVASCIVDR